MGSPQASKARGRRGENLSLTTFLHRWWPRAERRRQKGVLDQGDIAGTPYCIEVKNAERWCIPQWLRELEVETAHAPEDHGFIMVRRNKHPWVFIVPESTMAHLLNLAHPPLSDDADARRSSP